jgi:hypothetical protein
MLKSIGIFVSNEKLEEMHKRYDFSGQYSVSFLELWKLIDKEIKENNEMSIM